MDRKTILLNNHGLTDEEKEESLKTDNEKDSSQEKTPEEN